MDEFPIYTHPSTPYGERKRWMGWSFVCFLYAPAIGRRSKKMFDVLDSASFEMADFYYRERSHTIEYRIITLSHSTKTVMLVYIIYSSMLVKKRKKKRNEMFGYCHIFRDILSLLSTIDPLLMQQASIFEFQMNLPDSVSSSPPTIVTNARLGTR